ncbi:MAG: RluA family pseudouridine synthase [Flavobacteriaceae bacterium]
MLSQGDNTGDASVLDVCKNMIKHRDQKPGNVYLGLPHRLDRPTSGVMVLAKTSKALTRLNKQFVEKSTQKIYWAMVTGTPNASPIQLKHYLVRKASQNKSYAHKKEVPNSKIAKLTYTKKQTFDRYSLLEIELLTGRHHQIRAQLSAEGLSIKGDLKYGAKRPNKDGSIHLHARKLTITHPTLKEPLTFTAPPPKDALWDDVNTQKV